MPGAFVIGVRLMWGPGRRPEAGSEAEREGGGYEAVALDLLVQPGLDQRLIRHIPRIGRNLDGIQQMLGQPQGNRPARGFQVRENGLPGLGPVQILGGVVCFPERPFIGFVMEDRDILMLSVHKRLALFGACRWRK